MMSLHIHNFDYNKMHTHNMSIYLVHLNSMCLISIISPKISTYF